MEKINAILIIIAIINIIFAFSLFLKEGIIIYVDSSNREMVKNALQGAVINKGNIDIIILGQGWHSGELTIYHSYGKKETVNITEGMFKLGELEDYIRNNGYHLDNLGFILLGSSGIIILYVIIYSMIIPKETI